MKTEKIPSKLALIVVIMFAPLIYNEGWNGAIANLVVIVAITIFILFDSKARGQDE